MPKEKEKAKVGFVQKHFYLLTDLWDYLKVRKKWWLLPLIIMILLTALILFLGESTIAGPFIYPLM